MLKNLFFKNDKIIEVIRKMIKMIESFSIHDLNEFNGPLDLLLHLIKTNEIEILNVNLTEITNQYINYINLVKDKSIDVASEYLSMATYLIELKSNFLIPKEEIDVLDDWEENRRNEFVARLLEYHKIKEVSEFFKERQKITSKFISKPKSIIKITKINDDSLPLAPNTLDIDKFAKVFLRVIEKNKKNEVQVRNLNLVEISPEIVTRDIKKIIDNAGSKPLNLEELIEDEKFSIGMLVIVFVSILELAKNQYITIQQNNEEIIIKKVFN